MVPNLFHLDISANHKQSFTSMTCAISYRLFDCDPVGGPNKKNWCPVPRISVS